jgi:hypothetical protein
MTTKTIKNLLTTSEVAEILGLTVGRINQIARGRDLGIIKGNTRIFTPKELRTIKALTDGGNNETRKSRD